MGRRESCTGQEGRVHTPAPIPKSMLRFRLPTKFGGVLKVFGLTEDSNFLVEWWLGWKAGSAAFVGRVGGSEVVAAESWTISRISCGDTSLEGRVGWNSAIGGKGNCRSWGRSSWLSWSCRGMNKYGRVVNHNGLIANSWTGGAYLVRVNKVPRPWPVSKICLMSLSSPWRSAGSLVAVGVLKVVFLEGKVVNPTFPLGRVT